VNPTTPPADSSSDVQPLAGWRVISSSAAQDHLFSSTRIAVVGNDNLGVGSLPPTRKTGQPNVEQMKASGSSDAGSKQMQAEQPRNCGAMSQQGSFSYHGNVSVPQKLVHLVGCRDPKVRAEPWTRPARKR
jgi:hypothetical protein